MLRERHVYRPICFLLYSTILHSLHRHSSVYLYTAVMVTHAPLFLQQAATMLYNTVLAYTPLNIAVCKQ